MKTDTRKEKLQEKNFLTNSLLKRKGIALKIANLSLRFNGRTQNSSRKSVSKVELLLYKL